MYAGEYNNGMLRRKSYWQYSANPYSDGQPELEKWHRDCRIEVVPEMKDYLSIFRAHAAMVRYFGVAVLKAADTHVPQKLPANAKYTPLTGLMENSNLGSSSAICY